MTTTRRDVRDRLQRLGDQPAAEPSRAFVADLERRLLHDADTTIAAAPPPDLRDRLVWLGEQPVLGPSPEFVAGLERRLVDPVRAHATPVSLPTRRRPLTRIVAAAAASVAVVLLAGALLGAFSHSGRSLHLGKAVNTKVVLPGGQTVSGRRGLSLPNGAVVSTGSNGQASAGSVDLGPGLQATVNAGRLQLTPTPSPPILPQVQVPQLPPVTLPAVPPLPIPTTLPHLP